MQERSHRTSLRGSAILLCTVCLFGLLVVLIFPCTSGPFTASHGPGMAFSSIQNVEGISLSMVLVTLQIDYRSIIRAPFRSSSQPSLAATLRLVQVCKGSRPLLC